MDMTLSALSWEVCLAYLDNMTSSHGRGKATYTVYFRYWTIRGQQGYSHPGACHASQPEECLEFLEGDHLLRTVRYGLICRCCSFECATSKATERSEKNKALFF